MRWASSTAVSATLSMYRPKNTIPPWVNLSMLGSLLSVAAGIFGFYDYFLPPASEAGIIDVEENLSDLYIAGLALIGGLLGIYGNVK